MPEIVMFTAKERVYKNGAGNATLDSNGGKNTVLYECGAVLSLEEAKKAGLPELFKKNDATALKHAAEVSPQSVTPQAVKDAKS